MSIFSSGNNINQLQFDLGNYNIEKIRVVRTPLPKIVQKLGKSIVGKPTHADKFFHLFTEISAVNNEGKREVFALEKNERINVLRNLSGGIPEPSEGKEIDLGGRKITVREFINNGKLAHARAGTSYEKYSLKCANCQQFTLLHLRGNELEGGNEDVIKFVSEPLAQTLPRWAEKITNFITDSTAWIGNKLNDIKFF